MKDGESGTIKVTMNLLGRVGDVTKSVFVHTSAGTSQLKVQAHIPGGGRKTMAGGLTERQRNQLIALRDPQAVFKGDCAACHAAPTVGKTGRDLYVAACFICHDSENRASMVPDLHAMNKPTNREYWNHWIRLGRKGSLMPAFAKDKGGPLDDNQIKSLVEYLMVTVTEGETDESLKGPVAHVSVASDEVPEGSSLFEKWDLLKFQPGQ